MERIGKIKFKNREDYFYEKIDRIEMYRESIEFFHGKDWYLSDEVCYILNENEYNGYQKALRMIEDRTLQQIKKSEADKHGFRLLRGKKAKKERNYKEAWLMRRETPISTDIDMDTAYEMIRKLLKEHYNFIEGVESQLLSSSMINEATKKEIEKRGMSIKNPKVITSIYEITANYGRGVYEVAYWATAPI